MSEADSDRMVKIDVRVPAELLGEIDATYEERGYPSRSEAVRDALRDWANPSVELSDELLADLAESSRQRKRGETLSAEDARKRVGLDDST